MYGNSSVVLVGNVTRDPELKTTSGGISRVSFSIAVNEGRDDNERTHFVNVTAWRSLADNLVESISKGDRVLVSGRVSSYEREVQVKGEDVKLNITTFEADHVGPELRFATAEVTRNKKSSNGESEAPAKSETKSKAKAADDDGNDF